MSEARKTIPAERQEVPPRGIRLRLFAAIVAIACGAGALLIAIQLLRSVLA